MLSEKSFRQLPVFITSMSRWDGDTSSASLALAKVLSRTNTVYYIDFPWSYTDYWRERKKPSVNRRRKALLWGKDFLQSVPGFPGLKNVTPKLVWPSYSLSPGTLYNIVRLRNDKLMAGTIKKIIRDKEIQDYLFLNSFNPSYLSDINQYLQPSLSIYQSRDAIEQTHVPSISREDNCVHHYDVTVATSKQICRNIERRTGRKVQYLPNGGDAQLFRTAVEGPLPKPVELQNIYTPIIGYTGAVCQRIDYELLMKMAKVHFDKTIVFVGPRREKEHTDIDLDAIPNIVFTGPKKLEELPAYLQHFDCAIIPFRYDNLTAGIYPLKINEYLAGGKAVVTTDFSEDIAAFRDDVYLANSHEDFLQAIDKAIADNSKECQQKRLAAASQNSWENRAEMFWSLAWKAYLGKHKKISPVRAGDLYVVH